MNSQSILGYANGSPFRNSPYLDIETPEGLITMENTPIDLLGIDNLGNTKKMKANSKNPYKFAGSTVREIPLQTGGWMPNAGNPGMIGDESIQDALKAAMKLKVKDNGKFKGLIPLDSWNDDVMNYIDKFKMVNRKKQQFVKVRGQLPEGFHKMPDGSIMPDAEMLRKGGNPYYQQGGVTNAQMFNFLFDDEEEETKTTTAPSVEEVEEEVPEQRDRMQDEMSMQLAMSPFGNPYKRQQMDAEHNAFMGSILSGGSQGAQNVGMQGREIYGRLAGDLGYSPVANSIYRTQAQQNELIAKGTGVKNSYHLTGDAVDLKPQDWHRLPPEKQQYYRTNYDVVYHNNHYHIEPKNK